MSIENSNLTPLRQCGLRPRTRPDGFPTRADMRLMSAAELEIFNAVHTVESLGADKALTDAVNLLHQARDRVADYLEGLP